MFLKKFVFVNWGNVPNGVFDFGPVSLFSGANSSGKTTAADAIQTVMTAAHENRDSNISQFQYKDNRGDANITFKF